MGKKLKEEIYFILFRLCTYTAMLVLALVLIALFLIGGQIINWHFITSSWSHNDITLGGIFPAIIGSLILGVGVGSISFPFGFATALFLTEYTEGNVWRRFIELTIRNLAGIPSIVYGMFGLAIFVRLLSFGTSLLSAILTLSIMTLPWIITAAVESLIAVPSAFREASLALGATRWQTIWKIVLPAALPAGITGGILANARAMGETAPIILVGATFYLSRLPTSLTDKFMALPYHTFILSTQHASSYALSYAAATALVLMAITGILSLSAIGVRYYFRIHKDW